jgi:hypothetical protein
MQIARKIGSELSHRPAGLGKRTMRSPSENVVRNMGKQTSSKQSTVQIPESSTRIYVYSGSSLVGKLVSAIKQEFHLNVEIVDSATGERLTEGSELKVSGASTSMEAFLRAYF